MSNQPVAESLKKVLANSYALYLKTQNYHWNVRGPQFGALHQLFEEQYTELAAAIDEIAERIRALDVAVPASFQQFSKDQIIQDGNENADAATMVNELAQDHKTIGTLLKEGMAAAENADDEASFDLLVQRTQVHEKARWMLKSSL